MFKNIYDFGKFDNIIVTDDNIKKIREKLNVDEQIPLLGMFNECVFIFRESTSSQYIYYKQIDKQLIHVESYSYEKGKLVFICSFDVDFDKNGINLVDKAVNIRKGIMLMKVPKEQLRYYINYVSARYMGMIGYFHLIQKNKKAVTSEVFLLPQQSKNYKQSKPEETQYRNIIKFDDIEVTIKTNNPNELNIFKKNYNKHTESWGVRGHYRTLKSGKKVFVKAYTKGDKAKYKPKDYEVI